MKKLFLHTQFKNVLLIPLLLFYLGFLTGSVNSDENNPHNEIQCVNCHSMTEKNVVKRKTCLSCHDTIEENSPLELLDFHSAKNKQCTNCHSFHETEYLQVDTVKFRYDFSSESSKATCIACHIDNSQLKELSDGHKTASKLYHSDILEEYELSPSQSCLACHTGSQSDYDLTFNDEDMPIINTHSSHPYEIEIVRGEGTTTNHIRYEIDPEINIFDNRIECQTCHILTSNDKFLVVNSDNQSQFCNGCHEHNGNSINFVSSP